MAKSETACRWQQESGERWADERDRYDRMLEPIGDSLLTAAGLRPGARVLDVGCGAGATTIKAASAVGPTGQVAGIDLSQALLNVAKDRARRRGLRNVEFIEGDAAQHRAENRRWDTIISRFGTLHFSEPARAFAQLARLLAPGGRIAFTAWQAESLNGWSALPAAAVAAHLPSGTDLQHRAAAGPFTLADPQRVGTLLAQAGLVDVELRSTSEPVWVASDIDDALEFFDAEAGAALRAVAPPETVEAVRDTLRDSLRPYAGGARVFLPAAAWIATATAPV